MNVNTVDIMNRGMQCLTEKLGVIEAEHFIAVIIREKFDYTQWQHQYFDSMEPGGFSSAALEYGKKHPYTGNAEKL